MLRILVVLAVCVIAAMAAEPIASITSRGTVELSGIEIQSTLLPSLPVVPGDDVATFSFPAIMVFRDKSRVVLGTNSRVRLETAGGQTQVRLLDGSLDFNLAAGSGLRVLGPGGSIEPQSGSKGSAAVAGNKKVLGGVPPGGLFDILAPINTAPPKTCPNPHGDKDPRKGPGPECPPESRHGNEQLPGCDFNCGKGNGK